MLTVSGLTVFHYNFNLKIRDNGDQRNGIDVCRIGATSQYRSDVGRTYQFFMEWVKITKIS